MGLEAGGRGGTKEKEKEEKEKEEKIPHMCESIGHRPLRGRCPKGDRPTNQPTEGRTDKAGCRVACNLVFSENTTTLDKLV